MEKKEYYLQKHFGYSSFKKGQEDIINSICENKDSLAIMPTGAGKSICYQLPAIIAEGITIVVSPLISLMKDQVDSLIQLKIPAAYINSSLNENQISKALTYAKDLKYKIIYVAPERLLSTEFLNFAKSVDIYMVTVDEAHCISRWGQDFRPSYLDITKFIDELSNNGKRPIVSAFTATATTTVKEDIASILKLNNPNIVMTGFNRENLYFEVSKPNNKLTALLNFLEDYKSQSGIIYCSTRKIVEETYEELKKSGFKVAPYHAGLPDETRKTNQDDFIYDRTQIIVATNAFGMGIDKSNVSFVVHYNMPKDIESYYQEAGRAGRDGSSAKCTMFFCNQDIQTNRYFIEKNELEDKDLINKEYEKLNDMIAYSTSNECLRNYILNYFGENVSENCGCCSNCNSEFEILDITEDAKNIIECIKSLRTSYGAVMISQIISGERIQKIIDLKLNESKFYKISNKTTKFIRDIISFLILEGYIIQTQSQYPVLELCDKSYDILNSNTTINMKVQKHTENLNGNSNTSNSSYLLNNLDNNTKDLYEELSALRRKISNEKSIAPFIVFSNHSLIDMCIKLPIDLNMFESISGVGQAKLEEFGEEFVRVISNYCEKNNIKGNVEVKSNSDIKNPDDYDITIPFSEEPVNIAIIVKRINNLFIEQYNKNLTPVKLADWLVSKGYLELIKEDGKSFKNPTEKGLSNGIFTEKRTRPEGEIYTINIYNYEMQKFIIDNIKEIITTCC